VSARPDVRRHEELLRELQSIMHAEGFAHWRVGELAARLRCSRTTLYRLAPSKDELVLLLIDRYGDAATTEARLAAERMESPAEAICEYTRVIDRWQKMGSERFWTDVYADERARSLIEDVYSPRGVAVAKSHLDRGVASGQFRPVNTDFFSHVIWAAAGLTRNPSVLAECGIESGDAMRELGMFIVYGMGWPEGQGPADT
jgi:AcrR family transcriptional regulator